MIQWLRGEARSVEQKDIWQDKMEVLEAAAEFIAELPIDGAEVMIWFGPCNLMEHLIKRR